MAEGWICLHRKILDWEWYSDPAAFRLFLHILLKANHEDTVWKGKQIKRAQFLTSRDHISVQTGLTPKQIRRAEEGLTKSGSLGIQTTNKFTIYTIIKYEDYQIDIKQRANKGQTKGKQGDKQRATNNNEEQDNNDILVKPDIGFTLTPTEEDKPKIKKGASRIADDWELDEDLGKWAEAQGLNYKEVLHQADLFKDHWLAAPGARGLKENWDSTWRNWIRKYIKDFRT